MPLQPLPIEDGDTARGKAEDAGALQGADRAADTGAAHAEHARQQLLRQRQDARPEAVAGHEQPARQALADGVAAVAGGDLPGLVAEGIGVAQHLRHQAGALPQRLLESVGWHAQGEARRLHHRLLGRAVGAQRQSQAHHAFPADHAHLDRVAALEPRHQGHEAGFEEMHRGNRRTRGVEELPRAKHDRLEHRLQPRQVMRGQGREDAVERPMIQAMHRPGSPHGMQWISRG
jgi:hypothetical protein